MQRDDINFVDNDSAMPIGPVNERSCLLQLDSQAGCPSIFSPTARRRLSNWRNPILGIDTRDGGAGILSGLRYWNMDFSIKKNIRVAESVSLEFQGVFANVLNHNQWPDPYLGAMQLYGPGIWCSTGFGYRIRWRGEPRNIELGLRVRF